MSKAIVLGTLVLFAVLSSAGRVCAAENFFARIDVTAGSSGGSVVDSDSGCCTLLGIVGSPMSGQIIYEIGWTETENGTPSISRSAITDPEYQLLCPPKDQDCNGVSLDGFFGGSISFNPVTGMITGTPAKPGLLNIIPAVRDKVRGEQPYRGTGFWFTHYVRFAGQTWNVPDDTPWRILVIPPPAEKAVKLSCTFSDTGLAPIQMTLDYDARFAEVFGTDGVIAGVYRIDPDKDVLGWSGLPYRVFRLGARAVTVDRGSGAMVITKSDSTAITAHCEKRSATRAF